MTSLVFKKMSTGDFAGNGSKKIPLSKGVHLKLRIIISLFERHIENCWVLPCA
jgi:hypothetical protein